MPEILPPVDLSRPFVPEHHTQLFFTPVYRGLTREQKLRYNQLFGVRINELIMMLERDVLERVLVPLRRHPHVVARPDLSRGLVTLIDDERRHYAMFAELNRRCFPDIFADGRDRYFSTLSPAAAITFRFLGVVASRLAFPLYCLMALEESSTAMARELIAGPPSRELGPYEPQFVAVHRAHMRDEVRHVQIQKELVEVCLAPAGRVARVTNAWLFKRMAKGMTRVGRSGSGAKVVRRLVCDRPELASRASAMISAVVALTNDPAYQRSLFNRQAMPQSFDVFDRVEELNDLSDYLVGYDRP